MHFLLAYQPNSIGTALAAMPEMAKNMLVGITNRREFACRRCSQFGKFSLGDWYPIRSSNHFNSVERAVSWWPATGQNKKSRYSHCMNDFVSACWLCAS